MNTPRLCCANGQVLVDDADTVLKLRTEHRIVGTLEGSHPTNPLQNNYFGLPLILLPEEAALLLEQHAITLDGDAFTWPKTEQDKVRFGLFKDLHGRGYFITRGIKYGGDYLLYPGDPLRYHSSHIVSLIDRGQKLTPRQLVTLGRLCTAVKKIRLLSSWNAEAGSFTHITLNWSGF
ncbi:tRNA-splicing endonuclease subunit [Coemansia sp. RSA 2611]|nr:tRNA-splicing endonuclease subunit [Coemansia sp. RSA 2705]KAJ2388589.1 tRNA-splicing endonuclease subunit [Coemansia sp. RSA 2611]